MAPLPEVVETPVEPLLPVPLAFRELIVAKITAI
jgi:hypothetical protein